MKLRDSRGGVRARIEQQIKKGEDQFLSGRVEAAPDFERALSELDTSYQAWDAHNVALLRAKIEDEAVLDEYSQDIPSHVFDTSYPDYLIERYEHLKKRVRQKITILDSIISRLDLYEERPMFGASGGRLDSFHPRVIEVSGKPLKDGNLRGAVIDAFIALDNYVRDRSGRSDLNGAPLMQAAFSANKPILRLSDDQEEQAGFMMLYVGAIKAVRNQYAHKVVSPANEQEAMEWLGFASALFRLVDRAKVVSP